MQCDARIPSNQFCLLPGNCRKNTELNGLSLRFVDVCALYRNLITDAVCYAITADSKVDTSQLSAHLLFSTLGLQIYCVLNEREKPKRV